MRPFDLAVNRRALSHLRQFGPWTLDSGPCRKMHARLLSSRTDHGRGTVAPGGGGCRPNRLNRSSRQRGRVMASRIGWREPLSRMGKMRQFACHPDCQDRGQFVSIGDCQSPERVSLSGLASGLACRRGACSQTSWGAAAWPVVICLCGRICHFESLGRSRFRAQVARGRGKLTESNMRGVTGRADGALGPT